MGQSSAKEFTLRLVGEGRNEGRHLLARRVPKALLDRHVDETVQSGPRALRVSQ